MTAQENFPKLIAAGRDVVRAQFEHSVKGRIVFKVSFSAAKRSNKVVFQDSYKQLNMPLSAFKSAFQIPDSIADGKGFYAYLHNMPVNYGKVQVLRFFLRLSVIIAHRMVSREKNSSPIEL